LTLVKPPGRELDPERDPIHLVVVDALVASLRCALLVLGAWSVTSVIVAVPVAAMFRVQARADRVWRQDQRRRAWRAALR
jgi:hypothetical protein